MNNPKLKNSPATLYAFDTQQCCKLNNEIILKFNQESMLNRICGYVNWQCARAKILIANAGN